MTLTKGRATDTDKTSIFVVDDHPMLVLGLREIIDQEVDLNFCGHAATSSKAISAIQEVKPDLAIVDISLKQGTGLELIKQLKALDPDLRLLVCSMHDETLYGERALRAGAQGYINKEEASERVVEAIRCVLSGRIFLSERMSDRLLQRAAGHPQVEPTIEDRLTDRELEVFELLGRGLTTREIAENLRLSVKTIEAHRQKIKIKLGLENSNELVQHAVQWHVEKGF
jgi:DNA-binding NarL/FixJ family response regulator